MPDSTWLKADIVAWLLGRGVAFTEAALVQMTKAELIALAVDLSDAEREV